jgi:hypothetical protein
VVPVSNLNKIYYPDAGFTKGQVIDYYIRISPVLLHAFKGSAAHTKTVSGRSGGIFLLRETMSIASAGVGANGPSMERAKRSRNRLLPGHMICPVWFGRQTWATWNCTLSSPGARTWIGQR